jgi:hypothetical protein
VLALDISWDRQARDRFPATSTMALTHGSTGRGSMNTCT